MACPRSSVTPELRPVFVNNLEISVPSPPLGISSSLTALRRISRTSSSILRPCRLARRCKRVFTAFSMFRTTSCPTIYLPSINSDIMLSYGSAASQLLAHRAANSPTSVLGFPTHKKYVLYDFRVLWPSPRSCKSLFDMVEVWSTSPHGPTILLRGLYLSNPRFSSAPVGGKSDRSFTKTASTANA